MFLLLKLIFEYVNLLFLLAVLSSFVVVGFDLLKRNLTKKELREIFQTKNLNLVVIFLSLLIMLLLGNTIEMLLKSIFFSSILENSPGLFIVGICLFLIFSFIFFYIWSLIFDTLKDYFKQIESTITKENK